ncbi:MAG TPA: hypothetical protein VIJ93_06965 [bacterium]
MRKIIILMMVLVFAFFVGRVLAEDMKNTKMEKKAVNGKTLKCEVVDVVCAVKRVSGAGVKLPRV